MVVIRTKKQYDEDLKQAYNAGYDDGLDNHEITAPKALELLQTYARAYGNRSRKVSNEQIDKMIKLVSRGYKLKE